MSYKCEIVEAESVILAATSEVLLKQNEIPARIRGMFDIAYSWLSNSDVNHAGHNYATYRNTSDGMYMRVGFPVSARFEDTKSVQCLDVGGGRAAHTMHRGDYGGIPGGYERFVAWSNEQTLTLSGFNWEVYGDWDDDPAKLVTDLYLQIS